MRRKTLIAVALCLILITTIGGAASGVADLPGYADVLAAATGMAGAEPSGSLGSLPGYQGVIDNVKGMPGAAPSGSLKSLPGYQGVIDNLRGPMAGGTSAFFVASTGVFWLPVPGTECFEMYTLANFSPSLPDPRSTERATAAFEYTDPQAMTGQLTILSGNNASPSPYAVSVTSIVTICGTT